MTKQSQMLRLPMPFLFGVPASFFEYNKMEIPDDIVFVNIDSGKVLFVYTLFECIMYVIVLMYYTCVS